MDTQSPPKRHTGTQAWAVALIGALFYLYAQFLRTEPSIMVPNLMHYYQIHATSFGTLIALFYFAYTPMQLIVGLLIDRFNIRYVILAAIFIATLGCFLFAISHYLVVAGIGRFLIGLGAAFAFVGALKLATLWLPNRHFALFTGLLSSAGLLGAISSDLLPALVSHHTRWQVVLFYSALAGTLLLLIALLTLRNRAPRQPKVSFDEMLKGLLEIVHNPQIWISGLTGMLLYLPTIVFGELWGITYFERVYHFSNPQAAILVGTLFLGWLIGTPIVGWLSDFIRLRQIPLSIGAIVSALCLSIIFYVPDLSIQAIETLLLVLGIASSVNILCFAISRENSAPKMAGTAMAFTNMLIMLGGNIALPLVGYLLDQGWHGATTHGIYDYPIADYQITLSILPIGLILAALLSFALRETYCKQIA